MLGPARTPGRRGAFLIMFGALYMLIGYSYTGDRPTPQIRKSLRLAAEVMPLWGYGILWAVAGLVAFTVGLLFSPKKDASGFAAAIFMPVIWSGAYFVGWAHGDADRGLSTAGIFGLFAIATAIVSGMVNPVALARRGVRR